MKKETKSNKFIFISIKESILRDTFRTLIGHSDLIVNPKNSSLKISKKLIAEFKISDLTGNFRYANGIAKKKQIKLPHKKNMKMHCRISHSSLRQVIFHKTMFMRLHLIEST